MVHHDPQPAPIASPALTATAVLILFAGGVTATLLAIHSVGRAVSGARICRNAKKAVSARMEACRLRVAELAADPARARYAPLVERGEDWPDAQITYSENPGITVTCTHLQPIERAMRNAGIQARWYQKTDITAKSRINVIALQRAFNLASPVRYAEFYEAER